MYLLENDILRLRVLDPVADQERFGTRYCTGGYIFQLEDVRLGELLSGPTYPESFNTFDGQGIPDAFNLSPLKDPDEVKDTALILGIGLCDLKGNQVVEFCQWQVHQKERQIQFLTQHDFEGYGVTLVRRVELHNRTVRSYTRLANRGQRPLDLRWFPHPFYPQTTTEELCKFNLPVEFGDNEGFALAESGFVCRKNWPWADGHYQVLEHSGDRPLTVLQRHPKTGLVAAHCSYVPDFFPIWGNPFTFSWEPFLERTVAPVKQLEWWIDYEF